jgi:hypothetical protein
MRNIIDIDVEIRAHEQTLKAIHQQVVGGEDIVSLAFYVPYIALTRLNLSE